MLLMGVFTQDTEVGSDVHGHASSLNLVFFNGKVWACAFVFLNASLPFNVSRRLDQCIVDQIRIG